MYLKEILAMSTAALESPRWALKAQGARALAKVAQSLAEKAPERELIEVRYSFTYADMSLYHPQLLVVRRVLPF